MTQTAIVKRRLGPDRVEIQVKRMSACSHDCDSCAGCGSMVHTGDVTAVAQDPFGARVGQRVTVESSTAQTLGLAAALYLLPFVGLFGAYLLLANASEGLAALGSVAAFLLVLLGVCIPLDRRLRRRAVTFRVVGVEEG